MVPPYIERLLSIGLDIISAASGLVMKFGVVPMAPTDRRARLLV
jgi:hypothetical protein